MKSVKVILLVLISCFAGLLLCEGFLRLFTPYGTNRVADKVATQTSNKPLDANEAMRYLRQFAEAPGTDRSWFVEDPPPLPNRTASKPDLEARYHDFEQRGIFPPQSEYVWNRYYLESERCRPNGVFQHYPDSVLAFQPPVYDMHPRYRFPPGTTLVEGLVTNEFGLRGPPLSRVKPPRTIRIGFAGASTTINHDLRFSYPEMVTHWLNRFASANHYDVRFEGMNGGREGINSKDIAPIVREELLPLDPDLVVYYEGANQFAAANQLVSSRIPPREQIDAKEAIAAHKVPQWIRSHFATGDLLDRALNRFNPVGEPVRPFYRLQWPQGVDEQHPDVSSPNLPLQLSDIIKDLDSIRNSTDSIGARMMLCSFVWLAQDGMPLSPTRHEHIYRQLNTVLWPLRYADIRRLADFQNRVLQRYASARRIAFIDVAARMPQDPNLFTDAIHMTETGERLKAWIVFQQLAPMIRRQLDARELPRPAGKNLPAPPAFVATGMSTRCEPPRQVSRVAGAISLDTISLAYAAASIARVHPVKVITADQQWAYAAVIPLHVPPGLAGPAFIQMRARVLKGKVGVGVLDAKKEEFQAENTIAPASGMADFYVPVVRPELAGRIMIRNVAAGGIRSEMLIDDIALVVPAQPQK
jgi:hypothetical protein